MEEVRNNLYKFEISYNAFFTFKGEDSSGAPLQDVYSSSDGISWTFTSSISTARSRHTAIVLNNVIYFMGGYTGSGKIHFLFHFLSFLLILISFFSFFCFLVYFNDVWKSSDAITWTQSTSSADWGKRGYHTSVVLNNQMILMGGLGSKNIIITYFDMREIF